MVLASRSGRVARGGQGLEDQLKGLKNVSRVLPCDSADGDEVRALLESSIDFARGVVRGILHTAGIPDKGLITEIHRFRLEHVAQPKAGGATRIHQHSSQLCLDAMVQWSSIGAAFGNAGQGTYTVANSYLDSLTLCRRAQAMTAASMQWPLITGAGMGAAGVSEKQARARGMAAISIDEFATGLLEALTAMKHMLSRAHVPMATDLIKMLDDVADNSQPLYLEIERPEKPKETAAAASVVSTQKATSAISELPPERRQPHIEALVLKTVTELTSGAEVSTDTPLMSAGIDSIAATELSSSLKAATQVTLSPTLLFEQPTARAIASHIMEQIGDVQAPAAAGVPLAARSIDSDGAVFISGGSARWPGGVSTEVEMRTLERASGDAIGAVPAMRWTLEEMVDVTTLTAPQLECVKWGGWISDAERFDPRFFGMSLAEAGAIDPQQRLLLEIGYLALHSANKRKSTVMGVDIGSFVGIERPDWAIVTTMLPTEKSASAYAATGSTPSVASGRISFMLGLQGPCMSIDTACSSAMSSLHGAASAVRGGECATSLAGGVALKFLPYPALAASAAGMLSIYGRCMTFDARANGYVRTDGIGNVVLESGEDDPRVMLAVSAVRQDGRSASLTAPNGGAQRSLMLAAWALCGTSAGDIGCMEAHGTGTGLGDPTEAGSVAAVLTAVERPKATMLGAAKASVGHTEAPSGIVGMLKARRMLSGEPVASANAQLRMLNPLIRERLGMKAEWIAMPTSTAKLAAETDACGVNSFGFSGTIVHALVKRGGSEVAMRASRPSVRFSRQAFTWVSTTAPASARITMYSACWLSEPAQSSSPSSMLLLSATRGGVAYGMPFTAVKSVVIEASPARDASLSLEGLCAALLLAQHLTLSGSRGTRVTLVTSGAQPSATPFAASSIGGASHGGMWGFARVLRLEQPSMQVVTADVAPGADINTAGKEAEVSLQVGSRRVARLRSGLVLVKSRSTGKVHGCYVITGGLGGLGLRAAELVLARGASSVVLASRSGRVARGGQGLESQLAGVRYAATVRAVDAADAAEMAITQRSAASSIQGVLHAAGLLHDKLVRAMTNADMNLVASAKATAATSLHHTVAGTPLYAFVMYSSVSSALGNLGQANYSSSNTYLDALAACRRQSGSVARSLQWPMVTGAGMGQATHDALGAGRSSDIGVGALDLDQYALGLQSALAARASVASRLPQSCLARRSRWRRHSALRSSLPRSPPPLLPLQSSLRLRQRSSRRRLALSKRSAAEIEEIVMKAVGELTSGSDVSIDTPLMQAGIDSLAATELSSSLRAATQVTLSPTLLFEQPTARAVAAHILEELEDAQQPANVPVAGSNLFSFDSTGSVHMVGGAARWPGGINTHATMRFVEASCGDAIGEVPASRWTLSEMVRT